MTAQETNVGCCTPQTQTASCECECSSSPALLFPCSGGSDVGALSDQAARQMTAAGIGKMYCLAGIGGRVSGILASTRSAGKILAIDGCPLNCAKATLEQAGITTFKHMNLKEIGMIKGQSPVTEERLTRISNEARSLLQERRDT
ncbi:DGC domain protein [Candidatus Moduliflexus flocculans]|uniref:DGC domain protein n=1 Tax=Candidatus Moduliflexus flocculans TaxID=1499966 RepID=A0A081BST3_9BACT|nr:DGC domain protein [Candidatus Moduliflexus flocculans]